jgi:hypothetical protein
MEYKCVSCGCSEFISQLNRYDVFQIRNSKILFINSEQIDDKLVLYCRNCSKELEFDEYDIEFKQMKTSEKINPL